MRQGVAVCSCRRRGLTLVDQDVLVPSQYEVGDFERLAGGIAVGPQQACHRRAGLESKATDLLGCWHADGELVEEAGRFQAKAFLEVGGLCASTAATGGKLAGGRDSTPQPDGWAAFARGGRGGARANATRDLRP